MRKGFALLLFILPFTVPAQDQEKSLAELKHKLDSLGISGGSPLDRDWQLLFVEQFHDRSHAVEIPQQSERGYWDAPSCNFESRKNAVYTIYGKEYMIVSVKGKVDSVFYYFGPFTRIPDEDSMNLLLKSIDDSITLLYGQLDSLERSPMKTGDSTDAAWCEYSAIRQLAWNLSRDYSRNSALLRNAQYGGLRGLQEKLRLLDDGNEFADTIKSNEKYRVLFIERYTSSDYLPAHNAGTMVTEDVHFGKDTIVSLRDLCANFRVETTDVNQQVWEYPPSLHNCITYYGSEYVVVITSGRESSSRNRFISHYSWTDRYMIYYLERTE